MQSPCEHCKLSDNSCDGTIYKGKRPELQYRSVSSYFLNTAVVIPAFNEEIAIASVVSTARLYVPKVIVVDDGSQDNTNLVAERAGADVITLKENRGKADAVKIGCNYALSHGYQQIILLDGDGQHDPHEIPVVAAPVLTGSADIVIGSRFLEENNKIPSYRVAGQQILNIVTDLTSETKISDTQSGFRVLGNRAVENLNFSSKRYNFESDMITHFSSLGLKMVEIPISVRYDVPNKHKINPVVHGVGVCYHLLWCLAKKSVTVGKLPALTTFLTNGTIICCLIAGLIMMPVFEYHILTMGLLTIITGSFGFAFAYKQVLATYFKK